MIKMLCYICTYVHICKFPKMNVFTMHGKKKEKRRKGGRKEGKGN